MKRVFLIILDSVGAGALPDAVKFGDAGTNTLFSCYRTGLLQIPNLLKLGLGNIEGLSFLGRNPSPIGGYGRGAELSAGKDTTVGHWEIAGVVSPAPLPTYPHGFPAALLEEFSRQCGRGILCNRPYSGTEVIRDYGEEHLKTGKLIVYTSADSVFQIAAHEAVISHEQLYEYCRIARKLLTGENAVGRVIARPFAGTAPNFVRTAGRHDFSLEPTEKTLCDALAEEGRDVIGIGKIYDIFAGRGITETHPTPTGNAEGIAQTQAMLSRDFSGLCFVNLVDYDMLYGHRNNAPGYAEALNAFDRALPSLMEAMREDDLLLITADHGCDPGDTSTDHSREYTPILAYAKGIIPFDIGTRNGLYDTAATIAQALGSGYTCGGKSFYRELFCHE